MDQNLITWKIKYSCQSDLSDIIRQYNWLLRFTFNRVSDNADIKTDSLNLVQKSMNNCPLIGCHLRGSAEYEARALYKASNGGKVIFGGRNIFIQRCQNKISREEFLNRRLLPLFSIGEANQKGNRLFQIIDKSTILFKLNRTCHYLITIKLNGKRLKQLERLIQVQNESLIPISYKIDLDYIYITFDYNIFKVYSYQIKQDRVMAVDLNPNSIGWSVVDWKDGLNYHVVQSGTFSLKSLNDYRKSLSISSTSKLHKYVRNKRNHEIIEISKNLFNLCKHYRCETFSLEDLNIVPSDAKIGKNYNRLVNNMWNRNLFVNQIRKRINASSTKFIQVQPQWNSYIGNLVFRQEALPDECLASIEIGRRGWEFSTQYIFKRRPRSKTVIYPDLGLVKNRLMQSLEELHIDVPDLDEWIDILLEVKKSKSKYRFSTSEAQRYHSEGLFSKFYKNKYTLVHEYL